MELDLGANVAKRLTEISRKMGGGEVSVGFMEGATYEDGTPVAAVAYWNEYGKNVRSSEGDYYQLPRPFFRRMLAAEAHKWPAAMATGAKATNYDGPKVLAIMGEKVGDALVQSIVDLTSPPLAPSTIAAKGFDKPLIETNNMVRSITYRVNDGEKVPVDGP